MKKKLLTILIVCFSILQTQPSFSEDFEISDDDSQRAVLAYKKGVELKTNTAPMQRFVNAQNLTLITKDSIIPKYNVRTIW